jgi:hypothetical protein
MPVYDGPLLMLFAKAGPWTIIVERWEGTTVMDCGTRTLRTKPHFFPNLIFAKNRNTSEFLLTAASS